jgi:hypothetical protein
MQPSVSEYVLTIAAEITAIISDLPKQLGRHRPNSEWTHLLKSGVGGLGKKNGWTVRSAHRTGEFRQEWLYDLSWTRNNDGGQLIEVGLVLESEWGHGLEEIRPDFEKLLLAKSPLKVMVFEGRTAEVTVHIDALRSGIRAFHTEIKPELYILAALNYDTYEFVFDQVVT